MDMTTLRREFTTDGSTVRVTVTRDLAGWELREERDRSVTRHLHFTDWHRVERALRSIELALSLKNSR